MSDYTIKAIIESAKEWAEIGRDSLDRSMEAIKEGKFGTSEHYSRVATEAFDKGLTLLSLLI